TPAVEAMTERGAASGQSVEARAGQLERIRSLARVWKRLKRLQVVLITGQARIQRKEVARQQIRDELANQADHISQAIEDLLTVLPSRTLEAAVAELKRGTVIDLATRKFFQNPAVNLVLINEMNLGITHLETAAERSGGKIGLSKGPMML